VTLRNANSRTHVKTLYNIKRYFPQEKQNNEGRKWLAKEPHNSTKKNNLHGKVEYLYKDLVIRHQGNLQKAKKTKQPNKDLCSP
jgi:hypothetical protein